MSNLYKMYLPKGDTDMTIGDRIRLRRKELGLTLIELAERMGYTSRTSICTVEKNKEDLTTTRVKKFAEALETTPSYLMGWSEDPKNTKFDLKEEHKGCIDLEELIKVAEESTPENIKIAISMLKGLNSNKGD